MSSTPGFCPPTSPSPFHRHALRALCSTSRPFSSLPWLRCPARALGSLAPHPILQTTGSATSGASPLSGAPAAIQTPVGPWWAVSEVGKVGVSGHQDQPRALNIQVALSDSCP